MDPGIDDGHDDRLAAACAWATREKGWNTEERRRLEDLLADEARRRALYDHQRRMEFVARALAEMLGGGGAAVTADPDELEARVVALTMAEGLAPPG